MWNVFTPPLHEVLQHGKRYALTQSVVLGPLEHNCLVIIACIKTNYNYKSYGGHEDFDEPATSGWDDDNDLAGVFAPAISSLDVISSTIVITNRSLHSKYYLKHRISAVRATNIRTTTQKHESAKDAKDSAYLSLRSDWPKLGVDAAKQLNMGPSTLIVIIDFFVRDIKLENTLMILYDASVAHGMRTMSYKTVWWSFSVI